MMNLFENLQLMKEYNEPLIKNSYIEKTCRDLQIPFNSLKMVKCDSNYGNADSYTYYTTSTKISSILNILKSYDAHNKNYFSISDTYSLKGGYIEYASNDVLIFIDYTKTGQGSITLVPRNQDNHDNEVSIESLNKNYKI